MVTFNLQLLSGTFAIIRLDADAPVPTWAQGEFVSITRTHEELSIVCRQDHDDVQAEREWCCLRLVGKLDFSLVGVIATITKVLADASISVFVMSTYDTDYFLVRQFELDRTVDALEKAGHSVQNQ